MISDKILIIQCKNLIEKKLNWDSSNSWKQRDYENLIQLIYKETDILLSLTTIKRLWKTDYDQTPHPTTLNALAKFAGYNDWLEFKNSQKEIDCQKLETKGESYKLVGYIAAVTVLILLFVSIWFILSNGNKREFSEVEITSRKVISSGVPNTVIFDYDLNNISDSIFFQQSWNPYERRYISPNEKHLTAIYYFPGYHVATLISNNEVIKDIPVHITTEGWLMAVRYDPYDIKPGYISTENLIFNGNLHVTAEGLKLNDIEVESKDYWVSFFNVRDFGEIYGNNFELTSRFKNSTEEGGLLCQNVYLYIYCQNSAMLIPFGDTGCAANFNLMLFDNIILGRKNDMSKFGSNMNEWNDLRINVENNICSISLNQKEVIADSFSVDPGKIAGIHFMFYGTGSVDTVLLQDSSGTAVYSDSFE